MFSLLKRKRQGNRYLGVCFHAEAVSMALASKNPNGSIVLEQLLHQPLESGEDVAQRCRKMVSEAGFKGLPTVFVMEPRYYSVMQVEAPEVPPEELNNAIRWRIKDMIDFHIDDAVIDLIQLPESKRAGAPRLLYVIAARSSGVQSIVDALEDAGLAIHAIDIAEMALRNMTFADAVENHASAFLYLTRNLNLIEVCSNGVLNLSRHISVNTEQVDLGNPDQRVEVMDMLALEVQRSLDYYESQFANGPAKQLNLVSQCMATIDEFNAVAGSYLTVPISGLGALKQMQGLEHFDEADVVLGLPAIGGAIREFAWPA